MGFFARIANLWSGFLGLFLSDLESSNPAAVFEAAINERVAKHAELKKAVAGIVYLRTKTADALNEKQAALATANAQLEAALDADDDELAAVVLERREAINAEVSRLQGELDTVAAQAEEAKKGLLQFQAEIEKLKREKESSLAQLANAEARIAIQDSLSGLSTEADVAALAGVREAIAKKKAEADIGSELEGSSLDARLAALSSSASAAGTKAKLEALKAARAAERGNAAAPSKTL
jgi:phage shock protein A